MPPKALSKRPHESDDDYAARLRVNENQRRRRQQERMGPKQEPADTTLTADDVAEMILAKLPPSLDERPLDESALILQLLRALLPRREESGDDGVVQAAAALVAAFGCAECRDRFASMAVKEL